LGRNRLAGARRYKEPKPQLRNLGLSANIREIRGEVTGGRCSVSAFLPDHLEAVDADECVHLFVDGYKRQLVFGGCCDDVPVAWIAMRLPIRGPVQKRRPDGDLMGDGQDNDTSRRGPQPFLRRGMGVSPMWLRFQLAAWKTGSPRYSSVPWAPPAAFSPMAW
jgi:hypothetical protein